MHSPPSSPSSTLPTHPDRLLILYASETGNAQDIAERVFREVRRHGRRVCCISMDNYDITDLPHETLIIFITSTHGRGDPPPTMREFWGKLIRRGLPNDILEDVYFSLYGLGDSSYDRFCYAGKMLARRLESLGANKLVEPMWGDERAPDGLEETFIPWLQQTLDAILPYLPAPSSFVLEPTTHLPAPIFALDPTPTNEVGIEKLSLKDEDDASEFSDRRSRNREGIWTWATLSKNKRVTPEDWWQDVREIELDLDKRIDYAPGSICSIQPSCTEEEVSTFLELCELNHLADSTFTIRSTIPDQPIPSHLPTHPITLRSLITNHLDLRSSPRKSFFEWLRRFANNEREVERLDEFIADPDEVHNYATRPSRTIVETLADFRFTKLPLSHLLEVLPPLRRRQFSIASSSHAHPGKVQLLIALVEYKTNLKIPRRGLCSSWLDKLPTGTRIPIQILPPTITLPQPSTPLMLVGPGTGVAPLRALLEERRRQTAPDTILYFGCRSAKADLYFQSEWEEYRKQGISVKVATSRDQAEKFYVQDLVRRDAKLVKSLVVDKNCYVCISGSSNAMPRGVREAIAWCLSKEGAGEMDFDQATKYVDEMFDGERGQEESW